MPLFAAPTDSPPPVSVGLGPEVNYLLCATPRTGSYLLCDLLRRSGAGNPTEYFSAGYQGYWMPRWGLSDYDSYLAKVRELSLGNNQVRGVKSHPRQFQYFLRQANGGQWPDPARHRIIAETLLPDCRYVWLRRHDSLRQALSWAKSMQTNIWWDADEAPAPFDEPKPQALRFYRRFFDEALDRMRREDRMWESYFDRSGIEPLVVWYEDISDDQAATLTRVRQYLGVLDRTMPVPASARFRKQSDAVTERWRRRYLDLDPVRLDRSWPAVAGLDTGHDLVVTTSALARPATWDEARHSLLMDTDAPADLKPDYRLIDAAAELVGPPAEIVFSALPGPDVVAVPPGTDAPALAAHLGVDRVGVLGGARVMTGPVRVLGLGDELDLDGFLSLPPRPEHERRRVDGRTVAVLRVATGSPGDIDWAAGLASGIDALTGHRTWRPGDPRPDVVITDSDRAARERWPDAPRLLVRARTDEPALELWVDGAVVQVVPTPVAWWLPTLRPASRSSSELIVAADRDGIAATLRAEPGIALTDDLRAAHVVIALDHRSGPRMVSAASLGCALVVGWSAVPDWSVGAPFLFAEPDGVLDVIRPLRNDPAAADDVGGAGRDWIRDRWNFTDQWDAGWAPALVAATGGVR